MDTPTPIDFHRDALLRLVAGLFALAGIAPGGSVATLPKPMRLMILRVLRPAESALRRLVYLRSRGMALLSSKRAERARKKSEKSKRKSEGRKKPAPVFWLFDRRKFFPELADKSRKVRRGPGPRISFFDGSDPVREPVAEKPLRDPDDAGRLCRRMEALYRALQDVDAQAQRLLRAMAKRAKAPPGPGRCGPIRPGFPPGYRKNKTHEVDGLLSECHMMAVYDRPRTLAPP